jgi:hypothetical protein
MTANLLELIYPVYWRLTAPEKDMVDAENKALGDYNNHLSYIDWEPFDEDDERPTNCDRFIEWRAGDPRYAKVMLVAAALGDKGRISVAISTRAAHFAVRSDVAALVDAVLHDRTISEVFDARVQLAISILQGEGE